MNIFAPPPQQNKIEQVPHGGFTSRANAHTRTFLIPAHVGVSEGGAVLALETVALLFGIRRGQQLFRSRCILQEG